jgi:hypothetical protein
VNTIEAGEKVVPREQLGVVSQNTTDPELPCVFIAGVLFTITKDEYKRLKQALLHPGRAPYVPGLHDTIRNDDDDDYGGSLGNPFQR